MKIFLLSLFLLTLVYGQPSNRVALIEKTIIPNDTTSSVYFSFRVPFQNLVFEKDGSSYKAGLRFYLEITDTNSNFVKREIKDWNFSVTSFEQTVSNTVFAEGLLNFTLENGSYYILPIITDKNTHREFKLERIREDIIPVSKKFLSPIIIESGYNSCADADLFRVANYGGSIPFDSKKFDIIIPSMDISANSISATIVNERDTIFYETISEVYDSEINLIECENKIFLEKTSASQKTKNFIISGISTKLNEGKYKLLLNGSDEKIELDVVWFNKPFSLLKPEFAIKALTLVESENAVDSILRESRQNQYKALVDFWKRKDPSPETQFNELMLEYYTRVDYAEKNFAPLNGKGGLFSDRGKIYVIFGKPGKVERGSNEYGKVVETWFYEQINRRFVFVDKNGIGEFSLEGG